MNDSIIIGLLQNTAILISFSMLYQNFWIKNEESKSLSAKIIIGLILSGIIIVIMHTPWTLVPGITFDTRSVMLCIVGLFFGPIPTIMAMITAVLIRFNIGGEGLNMGVAVIITSGLIGLLWRKYRPQWRYNNYYLELISLGVIVHLVMSLCTVFLPSNKIVPTLKLIILPLILIYAPATMLLGIAMLNQYKNWQNSLAQLKLIESEKRFNQILKSGNIVSLLLNPDGSINFCNNYLLQITGYSKEEIIGGNWFNIFIPKNKKETITDLFNSHKTTDSNNSKYENEILTKDGRTLYISWHNTRLYNNSEEILGIASIGVNITETKKQEKILKNKNKELKKAKEKVEESHRLKSAFLANISHEIRTPMNAILGFSDLLKNPEISKQKQHHFLDIIEISGKRMLDIINDIINISKIESGLIKINITEGNINEQIENLYNNYKVEIEKKEIQFSFKNSLKLNDAIIYTDHLKIKEILIQLLKNAIKFTKQGTIEIGYTKQKDTITFYVKDTGVGITNKQQKIIFEQFRQGSQSLTRNYEGTGIGLSIANGYIDILGGNIWVESELEKGSTFYFSVICKGEKFNVST